jgi:hypothetical protein
MDLGWPSRALGFSKDPMRLETLLLLREQTVD